MRHAVPGPTRNDESSTDVDGDLAAEAATQPVAHEREDDGGEEERGGDDTEQVPGRTVEVAEGSALPSPLKAPHVRLPCRDSLNTR